MQDARTRAKTDKRVKSSFDKMRDWKEKAASFKAISKEKNRILDAAEKVVFSKVKLYEEQLDREFNNEFGELEKEAKQARNDYKKAKGCAKRIETGLTSRFMRNDNA